MAQLIHLVQQYGIALVFLWVAVQQAGVPIPGYPVLLIAGSLVATGQLPGAAVLLAAVVGCLVADVVWYQTGRRYGRRILNRLCEFSLTPDGCVRLTDSIFDRWGAKSLIVAKFVPGFATVAVAMAGAARMRRSAFVLHDVAGATVWSAAGLGLGLLLAPVIGDVLRLLQEMGRWGLLVVIVALAGFISWRAWQRHRFHAQLRMDRISVGALAEMLDRGESPIIVDVRHAEAQAAGRIPGAIAFSRNAWPEDLRAAEGSDSFVVVYCDCPNEASAAVIARELIQRGFARVRPLAGGLEAWRAAGYDVERGAVAIIDDEVTPALGLADPRGA